MTVLLAAHGTRSEPGRRAIAAIAEAVAERLPESAIRLGWLDHARPSVAEWLAPGGVRRVVPLLLGDGYHVRQDLAEMVGTRPDCVLAPGIGPGPELTEALCDRLAEAGWSAGMPVLLAAAGSAVADWRGHVQESAQLLGVRLDVEVRAGFLSGPGESVADALAALGTTTGRPVAIASHLLASGMFANRLRALAPGVCAAPLGDHPALVELLMRRCG